MRNRRIDLKVGIKIEAMEKVIDDEANDEKSKDSEDDDKVDETNTISLTKDVLPFIIPLSCLLTMNNVNKAAACSTVLTHANTREFYNKLMLSVSLTHHLSRYGLQIISLFSSLNTHLTLNH